MSRLRLVAIAVCVWPMLAGACASQPASFADEPTPESASPRAQRINWDSPLIRGITVPSLTAASKHLPFAVVEPRFPAQPSFVQVTNATEVRPPDQGVALVYDLPVYGRVVVIEKTSHLNQEWIRQRADAPGVPEDEFKEVPLRGTTGLLVSANGLGRIVWIEDGLLFDIKGPALSPEQAMSLASLL